MQGSQVINVHEFPSPVLFSLSFFVKFERQVKRPNFEQCTLSFWCICTQNTLFLFFIIIYNYILYIVDSVCKHTNVPHSVWGKHHAARDILPGGELLHIPYRNSWKYHIAEASIKCPSAHTNIFIAITLKKYSLPSKIMNRFILSPCVISTLSCCWMHNEVQLT